MNPSFASLARQLRIVRKELAEILRDRRTIVTLVAMPLLVYPILGLGFVQFFAAMAPTLEPKFVVASDDPNALAAFAQIQGMLAPRLKAMMADESKLPRWEARQVESASEAIRAGAVDVAITIAPDENLAGRGLTLQAIYARNSPAGAAAAQWIDRYLSLANAETLGRLLERPGAPPAMRWTFERRVVAVDQGDGLVSLTSVIPFVLILMTITGAVYPAIDLTAGERERGTMEVLVASPAARLSLLFAKYVAVVFVAVLTAAVNLTAMFATLKLNPLGAALVGSGGMSLALVAPLFGLMLLFAAFFSAVLLSITSFARSFKEAQAYLIPVMLVSLAPGAAGLAPGLKLSPGLAVTPLVNIVLLGRDLLEGAVQPGPAVLVIASTLLYAAAALGLAARVFGAESVLYNERNSWADLFRRSPDARDAATPGGALWTLALMAPTYFLLEAAARAVAAGATAVLVAAMALIGVVLFVGLPAFVARHERVRPVPGFGLHLPHPDAWVAAVLLGASLWACVLPTLAWIQGPLSETTRQALEPHLRAFRQSTLTLRVGLVVTLVIQALAEEAFFRGFLWESLRRKLPAVATWAITSLLFGLAHVVQGGPLGLEKFLTTFALGLALGAVRGATASVWPGMLAHAIHNAILGSLGQSGVAGEMESLPTSWTVASGVAVGVATAWFAWLATRSKAPLSATS